MPVSDKQCLVPNGMLVAAMKASIKNGLPIGPSTEIQVMLEAALRWLSENPIQPTLEQSKELYDSGKFDWRKFDANMMNALLVEWLRIAFIDPASTLPVEIRNLLSHQNKSCPGYETNPSVPLAEYDAAILEAYRRGLCAKKDF